MLSLIRIINICCLLLAFVVIGLGAYTRLKDAGLGCPDWPGCYGRLTVPFTQAQIEQAQSFYPEAPLDLNKASIEMTHRYLAETLGLLSFILSILIFKYRKRYSISLGLPISLIILILTQGLLGMWTVTLKLLPLAVVAHLIGGVAVTSLLWLIYLHFDSKPQVLKSFSSLTKTLGLISLITIFFQIFLGGWTSANYAALICPDFPMCQSEWLPKMDFIKGFNFWGGFGSEQPLNYMSIAGKTAIHVSHRIMAVIITILLSVFLIRVLSELNAQPKNSHKKTFYILSILIALSLILQLTLGILNVVHGLPLVNAVMHNLNAVFLFLLMISINYKFQSIQHDI